MDAGPISHLSAKQIQQLQRVFFELDKDEDGLVSEQDVSTVLRSLGGTAPDAAQVYGVGEPMDQTRFIAMMGEQIGRVGDIRELVEAFSSFDEKDEGVVEVAALRETVSDGDILQQLLVPPFIDRAGRLFYYRKCTSLLTSHKRPVHV